MQSHQRDTTEAIALPFPWTDLRKITFVLKSGKETETFALSRPVYRVQVEGDGGSTFKTYDAFNDGMLVHSWIDEQLWWNTPHAGFFHKLINVMRLYENGLRDAIKEVYAEHRNGDLVQVQLHPHYKKFISEAQRTFEAEAITGSGPKWQERDANEMRQARLQHKLSWIRR